MQIRLFEILLCQIVHLRTQQKLIFVAWSASIQITSSLHDSCRLSAILDHGIAARWDCGKAENWEIGEEFCDKCEWFFEALNEVETFGFGHDSARE